MTEVAKPRWTPGPWAVYADDPLVFTDEKGSSLGEAVPGDPYIGHDEALANARLIAAAPDLYEALEALLGDDRELGGRDTPRIRAAHTALARARGDAQ